MSPPALVASVYELHEESATPSSEVTPTTDLNHTRSDSVDGEGAPVNEEVRLQPSRKRERMEEAVRTLLECLGEDPEREGLIDTPKRMAKALLDCTCGYRQTAAEVVGSAIFNEESCGDIVIVRDIPVHSLCEHHMLPFMGKAHVAYIPDGKVIGLSKIGRIVDMFSRRLQVQERLTQQVRPPCSCARAPPGADTRPRIRHPSDLATGREAEARRSTARFRPCARPSARPQIASALAEQLSPKGVGVIVECTHMCMAMRGVRQPGAMTTTRTLLGEMRDDPQIRNDLMRLLDRK
jgi:GTP cyclohydrolase I